MLCKKPYNHYGRLYSCGQCIPCRVASRRIWKHRCMLELTQWERSSFVTLTYDDDHVPQDNGQLVLRRSDAQAFLKRLRDRVSPLRFRLFGVGEYGDTTWRPHFHFILFNYPHCDNPVFRPSKQCKCGPCSNILAAWKRGFIFNGIATPESIQYVAQYVTKKMTQKGDDRLDGRPPEFPMYSLRPGIGHDAMWDVASTLLQSNRNGSLIDQLADVPTGLRHGNKILPLGRYLRRKLRGMVGREETTPQEVMDQLDAEMSDMRWDARFNPGGYTAEYLEQNHQAFLNFEARMKIHRKGRPL